MLTVIKGLFKVMFELAATFAVLYVLLFIAGLCESGSVLLVPVLGAMVAFVLYMERRVVR